VKSPDVYYSITTYCNWGYGNKFRKVTSMKRIIFTLGNNLCRKIVLPHFSCFKGNTRCTQQLTSATWKRTLLSTDGKNIRTFPLFGISPAILHARHFAHILDVLLPRGHFSQNENDREDDGEAKRKEKTSSSSSVFSQECLRCLLILPFSAIFG